MKLMDDRWKRFGGHGKSERKEDRLEHDWGGTYVQRFESRKVWRAVLVFFLREKSSQYFGIDVVHLHLQLFETFPS